MEYVTKQEIVIRTLDSLKVMKTLKKEVKVQSDRLKEDLGLMDIVVKEDRSVIMKNR